MAASWIYEKGTTSGPAGGTGSGGDDVLGPVTGFASAGEIGTRYVADPDRLVHLTIGFVPVGPTPQPVTYFVSTDNGANWTWVGSQHMHSAGQQLKVDRLAPGAGSNWKMAAVAGDLGGDPSPIADFNLNVAYPNVVRSASFPVSGLTPPAVNGGITATIGSCSNVVSADGFTQSGYIPGVVYTDPLTGTDFFVRITTQDLDATSAALAPEQPHGGTQITRGQHTEKALLVTYIPSLAFVRYRFYTANRNSQGGGDFADPTTNTLQTVIFNGSPTGADHYDVPITIPPFVPPVSPDSAFNVVSVTASEVGPKYQDAQAHLHTTIGVIPVIDHDYASPRTVTLWFDHGDGAAVWQGQYSLISPGQVIRVGDSTLGTEGAPKSGDIYVPTNTAQGTWTVWCAAGRVEKGINPSIYAHATFTVVPLGACLPGGTTAASFVNDPTTADPISYSLYDPGIWYWEYYELTWTPPSVLTDPNYWKTLITIQKGATIGGVWTPSPDSEGVNEDQHGNFLGRSHATIEQIPGVANNQANILKKFGAHPATFKIPPGKNPDQTVNPYREFRFLIYNISRLGADSSGSGGAGTYTLQTSCWPGAADHFILVPQARNNTLDLSAANPATITSPLTGGNGQPLTIPPYDAGSNTGGIGGGYLGPQSVHAVNMAQNAITVGNQALAAGSVVDPNIVTLGINKVTYGVSVFGGDVVLSRGIGQPVIYLKIATSGSDARQNPSGIYLFGQADATTGTTGLTTKPYTVVQSAGIGLFQGGSGSTPGSSIFLDGSAGAITIYNQNGDLTKPYFTVSATALSIVNGVNSVTINSNAMAFVDTGFGNRIDLNSVGLTVANGTNKLVITSTDLQLQRAGVAMITLNATAGVTVSNGGSSSVVINNNSVQLTASGTAQVTVTTGSIQILGPAGDVSLNSGGVTLHNGSNQVQVTSAQVQLTGPAGTVTLGSAGITLANGAYQVTITSAQIQLTNGTASVTISPTAVTITNGSFSTSTSDYAIAIDNNVGLKITSLVNSTFFKVYAVSSFAGGSVVAASMDSTGSYGVNIRCVVGPPTYGQLELTATGSNTTLGTGVTLRVLSGKRASVITPGTPAGYISAEVDGVPVGIPYFH